MMRDVCMTKCRGRYTNPVSFFFQLLIKSSQSNRFFLRPEEEEGISKMLAMINRLLEWFKSLFWKEEMELTLVGLQHAGKTTFVNVIASGQFNEVN